MTPSGYTPDRKSSRRRPTAPAAKLMPLGWVHPAERDLHPDEEDARLEELRAVEAEHDLELAAQDRALERADAINDHGYRRPTR